MTAVTPAVSTSHAAGTLHRIAALARRDLRREVSYHFQLTLQAVGIVFAVLSYFFLGKLVGAASEISQFEGGYFAFALLGIVVMLYADAAARSIAAGISQAQGDDTLEVLLATPTPLSTLLTGMFVVPLLFVTVQAALYLTIGALIGGFSLAPSEFALALPILVLLIGSFCAVGVFGAGVIVLTKRGDPFSAFALHVTQLLAGVLFPVALLPEPLQWVSRLIPAYYGLRSLRGIILADWRLADVSTDLLVLAGFNVVLLPLALWAFSRALRFARITGTLGNR